ncbi:MAG: alpha/beta fold hydrolase [Alphaproteobacteria bacterium]|nr:alpha/beta fold hydrolase [Alphaproteobacteria bacterium]
MSGVSGVHIDVDGGALYCAHAGDPHAAAPALILLHGWTLDHRMWGPQVAAFARERLVLAPDRRGFGRSSAPPDLAREADDVAALLDAFERARAVILGMSQAGRVALDFALRFPDRVSALVLQGAPASRVTPGPDAVEMIPIVEYAQLARAGRLDEMKRLWGAHPLMHATTPEAAATAGQILADYAGRDLGAAPSLRDSDPQHLAAITAPALVIAGEHDTPWRRRAADALAASLPHAQRVAIAGGGHLCNLDRAPAFNAALGAFLARISA